MHAWLLEDGARAATIAPTPMKHRLLPLRLLLLCALAACSARDTRDRVVVAIESTPETLDRRMGLSHNSMRVASLITPGLTRIDESGAAVPDLASSFEALDDRTWLFRLRDGLRFSDGTPLRSADVAATFRSVLDPELGSPHRGGYSYIEAIETPDPLTVIFRLVDPFGAFPVDASFGILPERLCGPEHRDALRLRPIGAGPYLVEAWDGEGDILLAPNPHYHGGPPPEHLAVRVVRDETTRLLELRKGRVDLLLGSVSPALLPGMREVERLRVEIGPGAGVSYLAFNLDDPLLGRVEVRQAIALAIDREALARYKFKGAAQVADSLLRPGHWAFTPEVRRYERNLAEARRLLEGVPQPIRLTFKTSTDRFRRSIALAIQTQLAEAGITLDLQPLEWGTFLNDVRRGNYQMAMLKWQPVIDPDIHRLAYHSSSIPTEEGGWGGGNRMRYRNPELDALLTAGRRTSDPGERRALYAEVQRILAEDLPALPLLHEESVGVLSRNLVGVRVDPQGSFQSLPATRRLSQEAQ